MVNSVWLIEIPVMGSDSRLSLFLVSIPRRLLLIFVIMCYAVVFVGEAIRSSYELLHCLLNSNVHMHRVA